MNSRLGELLSLSIRMESVLIQKNTVLKEYSELYSMDIVKNDNIDYNFNLNPQNDNMIKK